MDSTDLLYYTRMDGIRNMLLRGDIIKVKRIFYWHYGIYIDEDCVIHYSCYPHHWWEERASIKITSLYEFCGKNKKEKIYYRNDKVSEKIIQRAISRLGEKKYSLFSNNCKHLVVDCIPKTYEN